MNRKPFGRSRKRFRSVRGDRSRSNFVLFDSGGDAVTVLLSSAGGFGIGRSLDLGMQTTRSLAVADVTGDGKLDLIAAGASPAGAGAGVSILPGNGDGTFAIAQFYPAVT
jgi:hypothetical protein